MRMGSRSVLGSVWASPGRGWMDLLLTADGLEVSATPIWHVSDRHPNFGKSWYLQQFADKPNKLQNISRFYCWDWEIICRTLTIRVVRACRENCFVPGMR